MTRYNEAMIWSAIHNKAHPSLVGDERKICGYMPLIEDMFPGINYYSITGFGQVMDRYVRPVLTKQFPDLVGKSADLVDRSRTVEVGTVLPSKGYEREDNPNWKKKLDGLLAA